MQKLVTFLPPDPTLVLAMKITEETYDYYLKLPAKTHLELSVVLDAYIVVSVDAPLAWGWYSYDLFNELYTEIENWTEGRFTTCIAKK